MIKDAYIRNPKPAREPVQAARELMLIGGRRAPAASGKYFDTSDPSTERVTAQVAEGDAADIDAAVASAREAFEGDWSRMRPAHRFGREHGDAAIENFTEPKAVWINTGAS
jgi:acyl-CoA reductase-like NAD-dependent aldehyde dehydrogenase